MSTKDYGELLGDTLALVNVARTAFGQEALNELPEARRGASSDCLYYRALDGLGVTGVGGGGAISFTDSRKANVIAQLWGVTADGNQVNAPSQFEEVIGAFDRGELNFYAIGESGNDSNDNDVEDDD